MLLILLFSICIVIGSLLNVTVACCAVFQRDTTGLTSENAELELRLQAMEQQAQLRDGMSFAS